MNLCARYLGRTLGFTDSENTGVVLFWLLCFHSSFSQNKTDISENSFTVSAVATGGKSVFPFQVVFQRRHNFRKVSLSFHKTHLWDSTSRKMDIQKEFSVILLDILVKFRKKKFCLLLGPHIPWYLKWTSLVTSMMCNQPKCFHYDFNFI